MKIPEFATLDFETEAILRRPNYPPKPVGFSLKMPGESRSKYFSWGHPSANNCTKSKAAQILKSLWRSNLMVLCHHSKFDIDVAETHFQLSVLPWEKIGDTEFLIFLYDPHAPELALKPSAERILGIKPEERDMLREWILANIPEARKTPSEWGAYICKAPGDLVGRYANGDVIRTEKLFKKLLPIIQERGMEKAYDRERRITRIFLATERQGMRCDLRGLERDYTMYQQAMGTAEIWLRKILHEPELNFDAKRDVGNVLDREGIVTDWVWTKGGKNVAPQRSVSKKTMTLNIFHNQKVAMVYGYRNRLQTCLSMFFEPWLEFARASDGFLQPNWNQVRQDRNGGLVGTRTGRPSCDNPNFLNVSKNFINNKGDGYYHPKFLKSLPELPLMRRYLLPDEHAWWLHRDYNQQELRMLAHFENGALMEKYREKPYRNPDGSMRFDIHSMMQTGIKELTGLELSRDSTKIVDFSTVYGKGVTGLSADLELDRATTQKIISAKAQIMPGVDHPTLGLAAMVKRRFQQGEPIRTWGGREYYCEEPSFSKKYNRVMTYEYKGLNYLIQPSSADVTKEALIRYDDHPKRESRFLVTVYDEINSSTPSLKGLRKKAQESLKSSEMRILREVMESIETDVPMLSDGKAGPTWGDLIKYEGVA